MTDALPDACAGLKDALAELGDESWVDPLLQHVGRIFANPGHGDYPRWREAVDALPELAPLARLDGPVVTLGAEVNDTRVLRNHLLALSPWRKGPWRLGGVDIDAEWRSDWKWDRLEPHLDLAGKRILDVGCGNGYYGYRMLGAGAKWVTGIDPGLLFVMQFLASRRAAPDLPVWVLPLGIEDLPLAVTGFDTVFSMGVLYHRHDHHQHLQQLLSLLRPGGELLLETLVLDLSTDEILNPEDRYANMRNVHAVPALGAAEQWLKEAGFVNVQCLDVTTTTVDEQRSTDWMTFWSLEQALDPNDATRTVEGHPAPARAVWHATRP